MERRIIYRVHAVERMFEWKVSTGDIRHVLEFGEVIESYPTDKPFPSRLVFSRVGPRPLHIVAADNHSNDETYIITVYEPDPMRWDRDFRRRR